MAVEYTKWSTRWVKGPYIQVCIDSPRSFGMLKVGGGQGGPRMRIYAK